MSAGWDLNPRHTFVSSVSDQSLETARVPTGFIICSQGELRYLDLTINTLLYESTYHTQSFALPLSYLGILLTVQDSNLCWSFRFGGLTVRCHRPLGQLPIFFVVPTGFEPIFSVQKTDVLSSWTKEPYRHPLRLSEMSERVNNICDQGETRTLTSSRTPASQTGVATITPLGQFSFLRFHSCVLLKTINGLSHL